MTDSATFARPSDSVLIRAIGFWALAASIVNVTIGGSIFALPGTLAASMGAAAPLAFILDALLFVPALARDGFLPARLDSCNLWYRHGI